MGTPKVNLRYTVISLDCTCAFDGNEHPSLGGQPIEIMHGAKPLVVSPEMADYFRTVPGLLVKAVPEKEA